jgi:hypothetical protein
VALGIGLLIGAERERRKGEGPLRSTAGIRGIQQDRRAKSFSHGFSDGRTTLLRPAEQELFVAIHTANLTLDRDASQRHRKCAVLRGIGRKLVNDQRKAAPAGQLPGRLEAAALGCWHQRLGRKVSSLI